MAKKDNENLIADILKGLRNDWQHRSGLKVWKPQVDRLKVPIINKEIPVMKLVEHKIDRIKVPGKPLARILGKYLYLDNSTLAAVMDTFENLGFVTRDGHRPALVNRAMTEYGWHLIFRLPPGISFNSIQSRGEYFQDATNSFIEFKWKNGLLHMDVHQGELPEQVPYEWDGQHFKDMSVPVPLGMSRKGLLTFDLTEGPHFLVAGETNLGKSNAVRVFVHAAMQRALVFVFDFKGLDFYYLRNYCPFIEDQDLAEKVLRMAAKEVKRRKEIIRQSGVEKIQLYKGKEHLPYIVLVIDEFAEITNEDSIRHIDSLVRLARAVGIHLVVATQRPDCDVIPGKTRSQFMARMCFPVADGIDSRMILGEAYSHAARLPVIQGRALFRHGINLTELQTMNLPLSVAKKLLKQPVVKGGWQDIAVQQLTGTRLLPR